MGDVGDYWREHKQYKRSIRSHWVECWTCAERFGGNGTKVPPGTNCRNCGWLAPGKLGDDVRQGKRDLEWERIETEAKEARRAEEKRRVLAARTCPHCKRVLGSKAGREQHVASVHANPPPPKPRKAKRREAGRHTFRFMDEAYVASFAA